MVFALDLDGVLADFVGAARVRYGYTGPWPVGEYDIAKVFGMPAADFWQGIYGEDFWVRLKKTDFADYLVELLAGEDVFLLTSPCLDPASLSGKYRWIRTYYPQYFRKFVITPCKEYCAMPCVCLIDDSDANVRRFRTAGGSAILVPQPWNSNHSLCNDRKAFLRDAIPLR